MKRDACNYEAVPTTQTRANAGKCRLLLLIGLTIIVSILVVALCIHVTGRRFLARFDPAGSPLDFFDMKDGLTITWYHEANTKAQLAEALHSNYQMLGGDVQLQWHGQSNQTDEPVMAKSPAVSSDLTLNDWMDAVVAAGKTGAKLHFQSLDAVGPSMEVLKSKADKIRCPVWASADVLPGPGSDGEPIDARRFLELVNRTFPSVTLSLGWKTGCCDQPYSRSMMEEMWNIVRDTRQAVSFPIRAALLKSSWPNVRWLLNQAPHRFTITLWAAGDDWDGARAFDLLMCRNDYHKESIYYALPGSRLKAFRQLSITAGSPLHHFPGVESRDGLKITWAHAVNSWEKLRQALKGDVMMLEADVMLRFQGTGNQTDEPIMAHPPDVDSDITLEQWLDDVIKSNKGMKLDIKYIEALEPAMKLLRKRKSELRQPVWVNADIFPGPNAQNSTPVNATEFERIVLEYFPECTLSIGWKTAWNNDPDNDEVYTQEHIDQMLRFAQDLEQPVTFPVRAAMLKKSWPVLRGLLERSRSHTLTVWSSTSDDVRADDLIHVRLDSEIDRIFYDLPESLMANFLRTLNFTCNA